MVLEFDDFDRFRVLPARLSILIRVVIYGTNPGGVEYLLTGRSSEWVKAITRGMKKKNILLSVKTPRTVYFAEKTTFGFPKKIAGMKKLYTLFAFMLIAASVSAQTATWVSQATGFNDLSSGVRFVSVVDTNTVWICSYDGSGGNANRQDYSRTTDGGATWAAAQIPGVPANYNWSMIYGLDANTAWSVFYNASGAGGGVYKTTDGGATWSQQGVGTVFSGSLSFPNVVHFWDANNGFLMGDPSPSNWFELYTTTDGGTSWTRVPAANIPVPQAGEYGIVGHYAVMGDTIWFDTNKGRVYRSIDRGVTWTVSSTGITVPANGALDICFTSASNGIARVYNGTSGTNTARITTDGGNTWTAITPVGNMFGSDMKNVPGSSRMVSTGAFTGFTGSSYSDDGGLNWTTIETGAQRTALGIANADCMWAGGFTTSNTTDGIFKYQVIPVIACTATGISAGTATATNTVLCGGDTTVFTSTGVFAPTVGAHAGVSWIITDVDVTNGAIPAPPSLVATYTFTFPAPSTSVRTFINNALLINGTTVPYGTYYWTPVVFGNALAISNPPVFLSDLQLDPSCVLLGNSVMVQVLDPADPQCSGTGVAETNSPIGMNTRIVGDIIELTLDVQSAGAAQLAVYDLSGRQLSSMNRFVLNGKNIIQLDAVGYASGTYIIRAITNGQSASAKIFKM